MAKTIKITSSGGNTEIIERISDFDIYEDLGCLMLAIDYENGVKDTYNIDGCDVVIEE